MFRKRGHAYRERQLPERLLLILQAEALYFRAQHIRTNGRVL